MDSIAALLAKLCARSGARTAGLLVGGALIALAGGCAGAQTAPPQDSEKPDVVKPAEQAQDKPKSDDSGKPAAPRAKGEEVPPDGHSVHKEHQDQQLGKDPE